MQRRAEGWIGEHNWASEIKIQIGWISIQNMVWKFVDKYIVNNVCQKLVLCLLMDGEKINILASCNVIKSRVLLLIEHNDVPLCCLFLDRCREIRFLLLAHLDR